MLSNDAVSEKTPTRQDQILLLASEGMTDKEIAARLTLSPETVGTYWRRILGKYSAASRTEVVAKVVRLQAEETVSEIAEVNECLKEVTDHLLLVMSGRDEDLDALPERLSLERRVLAEAPVILAAVDTEGYLLYLSRVPDGSKLRVGDPLEWAVTAEDRDALRNSLGTAMDHGGAETLTVTLDGTPTLLRVSRGEHDDEPIAVVAIG